MTTGFREIYLNAKLQDYWIRRLIAAIIDSVIIYIAVWLVMAAVAAASGVFSPWWWTSTFVFDLIVGIPRLLYFAFCEYVYGFTFGKRLMRLKVVTTDGKKPTVDVAFLRNVTKIYGLALLLDVVVPLAYPGDPTKKYTDKVSGTAVVAAEP